MIVSADLPAPNGHVVDLRHRLRVVKDVCIEIASEPDIKQVKSHLTRWVAKALDAEICSLFLRDAADPTWLVLEAAHGYPSNLIGQRTHRLGEGITGWIVQKEKAVLRNGRNAVIGHPAHIGKLDKQLDRTCTSLLGHFIKYRGEPSIGTLKVENKLIRELTESGEFTEDDQIVLETICGFMAVRLKAEETARELWRAENVAEFFHTFRSPIFSVRFICEMLKSWLELGEDQSAPRVKELLAVAYMDAMRFERLVNNSEFWIERQGKPELRTEELHKLVESGIEKYKPFAAKKQTQIEYDATDSRNVLTATDRHFVELVLANLLQNAIEYGKGWVSVTLKASSDEFVLEVDDNGTGMSEPEREQATRPGFRGSAGHAKNGLGLGLSVCEKAIHLLRGQLEFRNSKLGGLLVRVRCPGSGTKE